MTFADTKCTLSADHVINNKKDLCLWTECIEKCQFQLSSKYDREHDFDVIIGHIVPCRKLWWICRKHSNDVAQRVEAPDKSTIFYICRATGLSCRLEVTLNDDPKTHR